MRIKKAVLLVLGIAVVGVAAVQIRARYIDWRMGRVLVCKSWSPLESVRWSRDGKSLYLLQEGNEPGEEDIRLCEYDVMTGKRTQCSPRYVYAPYDISPDSKSVIYADDKGLRTLSLRGGTGRLVISRPYRPGKQMIENVCWPSRDRILFASDAVYQMDLYHGKATMILSQKLVACGVDGRGLVYEDSKGRLYYGLPSEFRTGSFMRLWPRVRTASETGSPASNAASACCRRLRCIGRYPSSPLLWFGSAASMSVPS